MPLRLGAAAPAPGRVAVVGAGPAGLECALRLAQSGTSVTVFEEGAQIGGQLAIATAAPHRHGWARLLAFYASELERHGAEVLLGRRADAEALAPFDEVVVAVGAEEDRPAVPGGEHAWRSCDLLVKGPSALKGVQRLVVVDDGWGWWPCVSAVEVGVAAGVGDITVVSPSNAFAGAIPAESRVQFFGRLGEARLQVLALQRLDAVDAGGVELRGVPGGAASRVEADAVVHVGERRARSWTWLGDRPGVQAAGDCLVPRRVQHAVSEGCAAADAIVAARHPLPVLN
jgi:NADPH-dependent 2,4-dienoyl-CoA reductase/sulfur reductase-like enzyme